jgi:hypothetical protein
VIDDRPRHYASRIQMKVTELIREELKEVPAEFRVMVVDEALNSICIEWNLKQFKAKAWRRGNAG